MYVFMYLNTWILIVVRSYLRSRPRSSSRIESTNLHQRVWRRIRISLQMIIHANRIVLLRLFTTCLKINESEWAPRENIRNEDLSYRIFSSIDRRKGNTRIKKTRYERGKPVGTWRILFKLLARGSCFFVSKE